MVEYEAVIGMEVHAQLLTKSKMFCQDDAQVFGAEPNTHVCPVCLGMPGVLPVANRRAVEHSLMVGLALNCQIAELAVFSRKNYFYPDLPKSYQISMYDLPLCRMGWIEIADAARQENLLRRIRIRRVHLEEDTAKSFHAGAHSLVDFSRSGLPLIEIVTEPDIRTPEEARRYLVKLRTILRYLGVSTGDMEKGAMRCEPNVSVRPLGSEAFGTKVEVKNLNSFRSVKLALEYEIERQTRLIDAGHQVGQVTMGWDEQREQTVQQRVKEESDDYRYFAEPDLPPLRIPRVWLDKIRARLPELPDAKRDRFAAAFGLPWADAAVLAAEHDMALYFEAVVAAGQQRGLAPKTISHWVIGELFHLLKTRAIEISDGKVTPTYLAELIALVQAGTITAGSGRAVLGEMLSTGLAPGDIVRDRGLGQISDQDRITQVVERVLADNPEQVAKYREGKETLLRWFVGQVMKAMGGKANPQVVTDLVERGLARGG